MSVQSLFYETDHAVTLAVLSSAALLRQRQLTTTSEMGMGVVCKTCGPGNCFKPGGSQLFSKGRSGRSA